MIRIIVIERGKKKRVINVDENLANIGRIPKNDVILPKPNVSKLHARLKLDGDKLVIEDMGSTNGTYLNGERIEKPEVVDVSDKVFIGDFILKAMMDNINKVEKDNQTDVTDSLNNDLPIEEIEVIEPDNPPLPPDEEELEFVLEELDADDVKEEPSGEPEPSVDVVEKVATPEQIPQDGMGDSLMEYQRALSEVALRAEDSVFKEKSISGDNLSDEEWSYYSDRIMQVVESMRRADEIPKSIDPYNLSQDILSEFIGLGPLDEPLADETIRMIHVTGCARIFVLRRFKWERVPKVFSSTTALTKIMARLVKQANINDVSARRYLRGRMEDGTLLQLLLPPLSRHHTIILERGKVSSLTMTELLNAKTINSEVVDILKTSINKGENIIICGPKHSGKTVLLNAVLPEIPIDANIVVIQGKDELAPPHINIVQLNKETLGSEPTHTSFIVDSLRPDWVIWEDLELNDVKAMLELIVSGRQSVIGTSASADYQTCLEMLLLELLMIYPALPHEDRLRMLYSTVDVIVSMERIPGTGSRVTNIIRLSMDEGGPRQEVLFGDK